MIQVVLFGAVASAGALGPGWPGSVRTVTSVAGAVVIACGGLLAVRGVLDLRENLTVFPRPLAGARLVDSGAYGLVRHPIYGGLILGALGWSLVTASWPALAATGLLTAFFELKSRREEAWLAARFDGYEAYRRRTRRFLPWLH